jgi:hypothetical protein
MENILQLPQYGVKSGLEMRGAEGANAAIRSAFTTTLALSCEHRKYFQFTADSKTASLGVLQ